jgi:hypothetical protein
MSFILPVIVIEEAFLVIGLIVIGSFIAMAWAFWRIADQSKRFNDIYLYYKKEQQRKAQNSPPPPKSQ